MFTKMNGVLIHDAIIKFNEINFIAKCIRYF